MALSIGVSKGSKIQVGKNLMRVLEVQDSRHVSIMYGNTRHLITDTERTEVEPGVFLSCGIKQDKETMMNSSRIAFEAPRSVIINRVR
jgi:hypothetical protein